jgi:hypothetical protein
LNQIREVDASHNPEKQDDTDNRGGRSFEIADEIGLFVIVEWDTFRAPFRGAVIG